jgi:hypothetical protein
MSDTNLPNPFDCARRIVGVNVLLKPQDIINVWHSLSLEQAERLFDIHGSAIAAQMLVAGIDAVVQIVKQEGNPS